MAKEYFIEVDGKRILAKSLDHLPRVGETVWLTLYGKVRAASYKVTRLQWSIAQEESPAYFNRPRQVVIHLEPDHPSKSDEPGDRGD
ncbi:MAG: hypothetical protein OEL76_17565 [Siculibacillus sp.]|nr:hypothetical protein [Siculibacillus sp.]